MSDVAAKIDAAYAEWKARERDLARANMALTSQVERQETLVDRIAEAGANGMPGVDVLSDFLDLQRVTIACLQDLAPTSEHARRARERLHDVMWKAMQELQQRINDNDTSEDWKDGK